MSVFSCFEGLLTSGGDDEACDKVRAIEYGIQKKKLNPKVIVDSDLEGGALEALGDIQYVIIYNYCHILKFNGPFYIPLPSLTIVL